MKKLWNQFKNSFSQVNVNIGEKITKTFQKKKLDDTAYDDLFDMLIMADVGVETATHMVKHLKAAKPETIEDALLNLTAIGKDRLLSKEINLDTDLEKEKPYVLCVIGVNGSGKTTTLAKLTHLFQQQGKTVGLVACDTFRAGAVSQLETWANRLKANFFSAPHGSDPASLAYESYQKAHEAGLDVLLIDTAGRLHNRDDLMEELKKIFRVLKKANPHIPHHTALVLDATTGQNAFTQINMFSLATPIQSLILNKLDGTAKGGIVFNNANIAISFLGTGEKIEDIHHFDAKLFSEKLFSSSASF